MLTLPALVLGSTLAMSAPLVPTLNIATVTVPQLTASIPQGAQRVPVLAVHLSASCKAPLVFNGLTVEHHGLGSVHDISHVYLSAGTKRLTRAAVLPERDPLFLRSAPITVPPCGSQDVLVLIDIAASASTGGEHAFVVKSIEANAPVQVVTDLVLTPPASVTAHSDQTSVTADLLPPLGNVWYGTNQMVARVLLTGTGGKDQHVIAITLHNNGSATNGDMQNFFLETADGKRVSNIVPAMDGRIVRIPLSASFILSGRESKLLNLRADKLSSSRRTISWELEETSDVEVQEQRMR